MDHQLEILIGEKRFGEYLRGVNSGDEHLVHLYYRLDLELRGLYMKSVGVVEHLITSLVIPEHLPGQSLTFGDLRRTYSAIPPKARFEISRKVGLKNQKELDGLLASLNSFRNRAAHHERIWNFRSKLAVPKQTLEVGPCELGHIESPFSLAANFVGIELLVPRDSRLLRLSKDVNDVLNRSHLDRNFILKSMGFETP